jgi:transcription initiation factor TFIID subunit 10
MADPSQETTVSGTDLKEEEIDASIEADINPNPPDPDAMNIDGRDDIDNSGLGVAPANEPKIPTKKDASLREFLNKMDDYAPIV